MSGMIALEGQLNGIIKEYLDYYGFDMTLEKFNEECINKGKTIANVDKKNSSNQKINTIMNEMITLFHQGQRKEFFRRWLESIPAQKINDDITAQKLELELNIHFAIYPFRKGVKDPKVNSKESIAAFKNYIENKGKVLCQTKEFLPYFGLPYHQSPQEGFPELFTESWINDLQNKLEKFLKETLKGSQNQPRLVDLCTDQPDNEGSQTIVKLKQQLIESEKRTMAFMRKFNKVQSDYHGLIGITAELVDSLENTVNGKPVSPEYIQNICYKLFNTQLKQTIDFTRPGTAGDYIRKSLAYQKSYAVPEKTEIRNSFPPLDFLKIKHDLIHQNEKRQLALLQALRWRLTKSESTDLRQRILTSFITGDILNCRSERVPNNIIALLNSPNEMIRQYMARLINTFASLNHGRSYLASNLEVVKTMHVVLRGEKEDNFTRKNLLAALQKLSLRHKLQILMINDNLIELLINLLEDNETLSDYSLEYAIALFMNLTLKMVGKKKCAIDSKKTLKVISELLGNSNTEIQTYVNGSLYNILSVPSIKAHAKSTNLEEILRSYLSEGSVEVNQQRELIIRKINSNDDGNEDNDADFEDDDDDDEEDAEMMELEIDSGEILPKQNDELIGEQLLLSEYSINNLGNEPHKTKSKLDNEFMNDSSVIHRPLTPLNLRQSQQFQSKQLPKPESLNSERVERTFQNVKNSIEHSNFNRNNPNNRSNQSIKSKNNASNNNLKQSNSAAQIRGDSVERKPPYKQSLSAGSKHSNENEPKYNNDNGNENGKANVLIIESRDYSVDESFTNPMTSNKIFATNDSLNGFANRTKIQRTPEQSIAFQRQKSYTNTSVNASSNSYLPKYSLNEPRPSSANSTKSKNSISSTNLNNNNNNDSTYNNNNNGQKKNLKN